VPSSETDDSATPGEVDTSSDVQDDTRARDDDDGNATGDVRTPEMSDDEGGARGQKARHAYGDSKTPFRPRAQGSLLERASPLSGQLGRYDGGGARKDVLAGVTVAALAIPSAMAYAELAGVDPVNGLYALLLPTVAYALLGSSRQAIIGPEGSLAALTAAAVLGVAVAGSPEAAELAAFLALLTGGFFVLARILRLGWLADYFSRPVLIGYLHGVAVVLVVSQLGKLLGLSVAATDPLPQLAEIARELGDVSGATVVVGAVSLAALFALRSTVPMLPAALLVIVLAILASWLLDLAAEGVAVVGDVPSGLPGLALPTPPLGDALRVVPDAAGLFLVCFADGILTTRAFAGKHGQHVRVGQEVLALGAANAAAGITSGIPIGVSGSRTAVNDQMGARSQVAGIVAAGAVLLVLLFLTEPIAYLPKAVLGAVIVVAALGLVDLDAWRALAATDRVELAIAAVTGVLVVLTGLLTALLFAVGLSVIDAVRRSARPHDAVLGWVERLGRYADVSLHPSARVTPGVVVYRLDDRLFFANASYFAGRVREALRGAPTPPSWLVLDAEGMTHVDSTGIEALASLIAELRSGGVDVLVARLKGPVHESLEEAGIVEVLGADHLHGSVRDAVEACAAGPDRRGVDAPDS
jgi:SulP family sulfate permease